MTICLMANVPDTYVLRNVVGLLPCMPLQEVLFPHSSYIEHYRVPMTVTACILAYVLICLAVHKLNLQFDAVNSRLNSFLLLQRYWRMLCKCTFY